jgi:hypothetical protein
MFKRSLILLYALCVFGIAKAQETDGLQKMISDMLETMADRQLISQNYEELVDELINLAQNPINLNVAEKEDLEKLFFLSDYQIENILYYRYTNGSLLSIYELQGVEQLDIVTIRRMLPFVKVEPVASKRKMHVFGNVIARMQSTFQTPLGYVAGEDSVANYLGSQEKWMTRARIYLGEKADAGFTLEKDQGEKAFPNYFPMADFTSGFVRIYKPLKVIDSWIIGDYRVSFGQGLGLWTDMAFSKSTETAQLRRRPKGINAYTSVNESSYLRGTALKLSFDDWSFTPFVSYKKRDASLASDSLADDLISSLLETGYHRTRGELAKRHQVNELVYGAQAGYRHHKFHLDAGYASWKIDQALETKTHLKDKYRFSGDVQETIWSSYALFMGNLSLFGELAVQNYKDYGLYQGLTYNAGGDVIASLAYRNYSRSYTAILSNPFSESSVRGGESGVFISLSTKPAERLTLKAFVDVFSYDWLRYNVYRPSDGFEAFAQADYQINHQQKIYLRYKTTIKEANTSSNTTTYQVGQYQKDNIRLYYGHEPNERWRLQTQLECSIYKDDEQKSDGWMAFQDIRYKLDQKLSASIRYILFDIEDYDSRIYSYEPDVLYAFTIPAYLNKGMRLILNFKIKPINNLEVWGRLAHTAFSNIENIGSGNQKILGNQLSEWKVQIRYRF